MSHLKNIFIKNCKAWRIVFCIANSLFFKNLIIAQIQKDIVKPTSYFVSANGNDKNAGTKQSPFKTIEKINSLTLHAGDQILFKANEIFTGTLKIDSSKNGIAVKPIIVSSYGKGKAAIDAGNATAIQIEKAAFINIKNLKLIGAGRKDGNAGNGLSLTNCNTILVDNIDVSGFQKAGIYVYASAYVSISKVDAHDNGSAGISVDGEYPIKASSNNIYIGYCNAINNPGNPTVLNNHSGNGIVAGFCTKLTIEYCTATNNGWDMPRIGNGPVGIWCYEADSVIIQHCISYRNKTSKGGDDGGGFDLDGGVTNSIIQYCLSYENQGSGFGIFQYNGASPWHNNTLRYCISENDGTVSAAGAGVYVWNSADDSIQFYNCNIYNNTIYNKKGAAISYAGQSQRKGFAFYNNIFVAGDSLLKGSRTSDVFLGNNWWSLKNQFNIEGIKNLGRWAKKSGQEMRNGEVAGLSIAPEFKNTNTATITSIEKLKLFNGYRVPANSPLKNAGLNLKSLYGLELDGVGFHGQAAPARGIGACF